MPRFREFQFLTLIFVELKVRLVSDSSSLLSYGYCKMCNSPNLCTSKTVVSLIARGSGLWDTQTNFWHVSVALLPVTNAPVWSTQSILSMIYLVIPYDAEFVGAEGYAIEVDLPVPLS